MRELLGDGEQPGQPRPRDPSWQNPRRQTEQAIRMEAVALLQRWREEGVSAEEGADTLGLPTRTIRHWQAESLAATGEFGYRGRRHERCTTAQAEEVAWFLQHRGPDLGMPRLRAELPDVPPAELRDLLNAYRHLWLTEHPRQVWKLHWHRAGAVWCPVGVEKR